MGGEKVKDRADRNSKKKGGYRRSRLVRESPRPGPGAWGKKEMFTFVRTNKPLKEEGKRVSPQREKKRTWNITAEHSTCLLGRLSSTNE